MEKTGHARQVEEALRATLLESQEICPHMVAGWMANQRDRAVDKDTMVAEFDAYLRSLDRQTEGFRMVLAKVKNAS
jgi:hypothetical protein